MSSASRTQGTCRGIGSRYADAGQEFRPTGECPVKQERTALIDGPLAELVTFGESGHIRASQHSIRQERRPGFHSN